MKRVIFGILSIAFLPLLGSDGEPSEAESSEFINSIAQEYDDPIMKIILKMGMSVGRWRNAYSEQKVYADICKAIVQDPARPRLWSFIFEIDCTLYHAASRGYYDVCKLLLDHGANSNFCTEGISPLYKAAKKGHSKVCELLVAHGARVNSEKLEHMPLYIAIAREQTAVCELLIKHGSDLNLLSSDGFDRPLSLAAQHHLPEVLRCMIKHGAEVNPPSGSNPLYRAVDSCQKSNFDIRNEESFFTLLIFGANVPDDRLRLADYDDEVRIIVRQRPILYKLIYGTLYDNLDIKEWSQPQRNVALRYAATRGQVALVKKLLEEHASPLAAGSDAITTLDVMADLLTGSPVKRDAYQEIYHLCVAYCMIKNGNDRIFHLVPSVIIELLIAQGVTREAMVFEAQIRERT